MFDTREEAAIAYELVRRKVKPSELVVPASGTGTSKASAPCSNRAPCVTNANVLTTCDGNINSSSLAAPTAAPGNAVLRYPVVRTMHAIDVRWESVKSQAHAKVKKLTGKRLLAAFDQSEVNSESPVQVENSTDVPTKPKSSNKKNGNTFPYISKLPSDKWKAEIPYGDKVRCIGSFKTQDDAVVAYEHVRTSLDLESVPSAVGSAKGTETMPRTATSGHPSTSKTDAKKYPSAQASDESVGIEMDQSSFASNGVDTLLMVAKNNDVLKRPSDQGHGFRLLEMAMTNEIGRIATVSTPNLARDRNVSEESMSSTSAILGKKRKHEATNSKASSPSDLELWDSAKQAALDYVKEEGPKVLSNSNHHSSSSGNECLNTATTNGQQSQLQHEQAPPRGVSQRDSGMWQAQLYFAGRMRYIGVFRTKELASLAHEFVRNRLQKHRLKSTVSAVAIATSQTTTTN